MLISTAIPCTMTTEAPTKPSRKAAASTTLVRKPYPSFRVIVLNDDFNTFDHVTDCLIRYIPGMTSSRARQLTNQVHYDGQSVVWVGPQEQAELYHLQLSREGLTMAPLESA